ncbi:MAG: DNA polymerase I [Thermoflexales bacterium]|nr:DNA polymerase I [Thermoflexales bacterium]
MSKPKLVLIDGHALAYRAYYGLPPDLKTRTGELTGAVYGFTSMLINAWRDEQPDYIAVTFDVGKTFRNDLFADYKATRAKMPDELAGQLGRIQQVVQTFNVPVVTAEGFEADDVLGTLAVRATVDGLQTIIVTGDTDVFQLIGPDVRVLINRRQWSDTQLYDEAAVRERYGLEPHQLIDYKALVGDSSDNVPGVKGVGDKTATQLLQKYGSLEAVYEHLGDITAARARTALEAGRDSAFLSKTLVTIKTDLPLVLTWEQCRAQDYERGGVLALFDELEFRSLGKRLPADRLSVSGHPSEHGPRESRQLSMFEHELPPPETSGLQPETILRGEEITLAHVVTDTAGLEALLGELRQATLISFDVETTGTDPMRAELVGIALAIKEGEGYYIPLGHRAGPSDALDEGQLPLETALEALRPVMADPAIPKIGHNAKYDMAVLARHGLQVGGLAFDTMIAEWLLDPGSRTLGLKALAWARLGLKMTEIKELIGSGKKQITMDRVPVPDVARYAAADADVPLRLRCQQEAELTDLGLWQLFAELEIPLLPVLLDMEMTGVLVDVDLLRRMSAELEERLSALEREIIAQTGEFNVNSPQQLAGVLFDKLRLKAPGGGRKTATGRISVAQDVLESMKGQHPIVDQILEHRQLAKLKSTYVDALPALVNSVTGRIHTSYNQTGTSTGRISSSDPNLQNIPIRTELGRQVRRAFVAAPGHVLVVADYSQVELRVLAHICDDPGLKEAFARGEDIHASTAATIFGVPLAEVTYEQRRIAKTINFGLAYGQGAYGLAQSAGISQAEAQRFIDAYFARFAGVRAYVEQTKRKAAVEGYVETLLGRRRYFPILQSAGGDQRAQIAARAAEREAINMPIQGSAADIIKVAMIKLHRRLAAQEAGLRARMTLQVHDELVVEVPEEAADRLVAVVREEMENAYRLSVALKVEAKAGKNWDAAK